ncbi:hypothetical protein FDP41_005038 [Naegleria fowleri]|uniref:Uncharacterized protein n=1 Tax=Naegleria fowleri TaxID=5763 RepID=A0A6A5BN34_NAEFO|nr:uncharacterized protein FDP41_005038 [Naegleria fowleri]KAF0975711.1 hypothetical protein FDP41_005038 [Naegleria fowleri]
MTFQQVPSNYNSNQPPPLNYSMYPQPNNLMYPPPQIPYDQYVQMQQQQQQTSQQQQQLPQQHHPYHSSSYSYPHQQQPLQPYSVPSNYGNPHGFIPQPSQPPVVPIHSPQQQLQPFQSYSPPPPHLMNHQSYNPSQPLSPYPQKGNEVVSMNHPNSSPIVQPPQPYQYSPPQQPVCTTTTTTTTSFIPVQGDLQHLQRLATGWFEQRQAILRMLSEMTEKLNKHAKSTTKAKMGGTVTNIVGATLIVGGLITAPLTLGGSLVATGAGAALVGGGTAATVGAAVSEWKHAKKSAQEIQAALERDAKTVNEIIALVFDYRISDPLIEQRLLTFNIPHSTATTSIPVLQFMNALVNIKYGNINQNGQLTHGNAGATSLASLVVKGVVPIVSVPIDLCLLVSESKKLHGKEPSKLASQVAPIIDSMKYQTKMATGITSL